MESLEEYNYTLKTSKITRPYRVKTPDLLIINKIYRQLLDFWY